MQMRPFSLKMHQFAYIFKIKIRSCDKASLIIIIIIFLFCCHIRREIITEGFMDIYSRYPVNQNILSVAIVFSNNCFL